MNKSPPIVFTQEHAERYDERNRQLAPITKNLHFLMSLVLENLPSRARVLSVGSGTGAEILSLAEAFPGWSFVAVEPSRAMLDVCRARMEAAGLSDRCEFIHGYAHDLDPDENFDVTLAVLVAHFIAREERKNFYQNLASRLRPGGYFVNAEISYDLDAPEFPRMLKNWESVQKRMGATAESLATLPHQLRQALTVLPPAETEALLRESQIDLPLLFFQSFMICAWYGVKS